MMSTIMLGSLFTVLGIFSVLFKFSPKLVKRILGYEVYLDILISVGLGILFTFSGTVSGMLIGAVSGFVFSLALFGLRRSVGYYKLKRNGVHFQWVKYPPVWGRVANLPFVREAALA